MTARNLPEGALRERISYGTMPGLPGTVQIPFDRAVTPVDLTQVAEDFTSYVSELTERELMVQPSFTTQVYCETSPARITGPNPNGKQSGIYTLYSVEARYVAIQGQPGLTPAIGICNNQTLPGNRTMPKKSLEAYAQELRG